MTMDPFRTKRPFAPTDELLELLKRWPTPQLESDKKAPVNTNDTERRLNDTTSTKVEKDAKLKATVDSSAIRREKYCFYQKRQYP